MRRAVIIFSFFLSSCAYHFGFGERTLPGGYTQVAIPVFKNLTQDVGVEVPFTDALIRRFARSRVAHVTDKERSPLILEGTIVRIRTDAGAQVTRENQLSTLPEGAVLTTEYRIVVTAELILRRKSDEKIVWQGGFSNEKVYAAPRIGAPLLNSANATYNHSARMQTISQLAEEMMSEAHDRITENF